MQTHRRSKAASVSSLSPCLSQKEERCEPPRASFCGPRATGTPLCSSCPTPAVQIFLHRVWPQCLHPLGGAHWAYRGWQRHSQASPPSLGSLSNCTDSITLFVSLFSVCFLAVSHGRCDLRSMTRNWTQVPWIGSTESSSLGHQESPRLSHFWMKLLNCFPPIKSELAFLHQLPTALIWLEALGNSRNQEEYYNTSFEKSKLMLQIPPWTFCFPPMSWTSKGYCFEVSFQRSFNKDVHNNSNTDVTDHVFALCTHYLI